MGVFMSIIEKLGITPGPWGGVHGEGTGVKSHSILSKKANKRLCVTNKTEDALLISTAPEMLEALIEICNERTYLSYFQLEAIECIEKATGKSWEEIKELL